MNVAIPMTAGRFTGCIKDAERLVVYRVNLETKQVCTINIVRTNDPECLSCIDLLRKYDVDQLILSRTHCNDCLDNYSSEYKILTTALTGFPEQIITRYMYNPELFIDLADTVPAGLA